MTLYTIRPEDTSTDSNAQKHLMRQFLMGHAFITLAVVTKVDEAGEVVSVTPMVDGFTGAATASQISQFMAFRYGGCSEAPAR